MYLYIISARPRFPPSTLPSNIEAILEVEGKVRMGLLQRRAGGRRIEEGTKGGRRIEEETKGGRRIEEGTK